MASLNPSGFRPARLIVSQAPPTATNTSPASVPIAASLSVRRDNRRAAPSKARLTVNTNHGTVSSAASTPWRGAARRCAHCQYRHQVPESAGDDRCGPGVGSCGQAESERQQNERRQNQEHGRPFGTHRQRPDGPECCIDESAADPSVASNHCSIVNHDVIIYCASIY